MATQIATQKFNGAKVVTAGLVGLVGGVGAKLSANSVNSMITKGLPDNTLSSASHNMTQSTSQRVLAGSQSLSGAASKSAVAETQVGAGYGIGSAAGMEAATKACTDYDLQASNKGC